MAHPRCQVRLRLAIATLFALTLFGGFAPLPATAQDDSTATLTIHSRFCPPGYEGNDIFEACHGNVGVLGIEYKLQGPSQEFGALDGEGNVTFPDLPPGDYRVSNGYPDGPIGPYVYCSSADGTAGRQIPLEADPIDEHTAVVTLAAGDNLICDWYVRPSDDTVSTTANLTIHNRFCPVGYDGSDEFTDCHGNIGVNYFRYELYGASAENDRTQEVFTSGNATFHLLPPGGYELAHDLGTNASTASVVCSYAGSTSEPFYETRVTEDDPFSIALDPGDDVICDWYVYPDPAFYSAGAYELPVMVVACEEEQGIGIAMGGLPEGCEGVADVEATVWPTYGGPEYADACTTNELGGCRVQMLYRIPLTAEIDETNLPAGYDPQENPTTSLAYTEFAAVIFLILPDPRGD